MNRGILAITISMLGSTAAQAHVSHAQGMAHTHEHLWLLLALAPALMLLRPLAQRLLQAKRKH